MNLLLPAILALATAASGTPPQLADVAVVPVRDGVNAIAKFTPDGREATIVKAWRDNGNAHGHFVYLVLLPLPGDCCGPDSKTGVVTFDGGQGGLEDTTGFSPFDGERSLGALRFARGRLDGKPATLVIRADLGEASSGVLADHAPVDISVYRLDHPGVDAGTTPDLFHLVSRFRPAGLFCNADMALATVMRLPLPADYAGGKGPSGCAG